MSSREGEELFRFYLEMRQCGCLNYEPIAMDRGSSEKAWGELSCSSTHANKFFVSLFLIRPLDLGDSTATGGATVM